MAGPYKDPKGLKDYYDQKTKESEKAGDQKAAQDYKKEVEKLDTYIKGVDYNKKNS